MESLPDKDGKPIQISSVSELPDRRDNNSLRIFDIGESGNVFFVKPEETTGFNVILALNDAVHAIKKNGASVLSITSVSLDPKIAAFGASNAGTTDGWVIVTDKGEISK